jgi:hypothetical protein
VELERVGDQVHYLSVSVADQTYTVDTYYTAQPNWYQEEIDVAFQTVFVITEVCRSLRRARGTNLLGGCYARKRNDGARSGGCSRGKVAQLTGGRIRSGRNASHSGGETWCGFYEASDRDRALESAARGRKVESATQREDIRQNGGAGAPWLSERPEPLVPQAFREALSRNERSSKKGRSYRSFTFGPFHRGASCREKKRGFGTPSFRHERKSDPAQGKLTQLVSVRRGLFNDSKTEDRQTSFVCAQKER